MSLKPYPKYKDTELTWLNSYPEKWNIKRGKNLLEAIDIRSNSGDEELLTVSSKFGVIPRKNASVTMFKADSYIGYKLCWENDLVINSLWAWAGGLGVSREHGIISSAYGVYRIKDSNQLIPEYLNALVRSTPYQWELQVRSKGIWTSRLQLTDESFLDAPILIPSVEEQKLIARYLTHINNKIQKYISAKKKLIKLLDEQKQAIIHQAVTGAIDVRTGKPYQKYKDSGLRELPKIPINWDILPFKHCIKFINDCIANNTHAEYGFKYLDISTVSTGYLRRDPEFILFKNAPSRARKIPQKHDTILSNVRTYLKSIYYFKDEPIDTIVSTGFSILRPRRILNSEYLPVLAQAAFFTDEVIKNSTGTAYPAINETKLGAIKVPIPPQNTQDEIVTYTNRLNTSYSVLTSQCKTEIELLIEFRTRLTADVVTGKIDVRVAAEDLPEKFEGVIDDVNEETIDENDDISDVEESYE